MLPWRTWTHSQLATSSRGTTLGLVQAELALFHPPCLALPVTSVVVVGADAGVPLTVRLQAGFAASLRDSLFGLSNGPGASATTEADWQDDRADLTLQLLLDGLSRPGVQLAHLLLGFHVSGGYPGAANELLSHDNEGSWLKSFFVLQAP